MVRRQTQSPRYLATAGLLQVTTGFIVADVYNCTASWGHTKYLYVRPDGGLVITNTLYSRHKSHKISQGWVARSLRPETGNPMSNSISALLLRSLSDVFGENDPVRRRAAIDEIFHEDAVFYDPKGGIFRGRDEIERIAGVIKATHPDFEYQPLFPPEELGDAGRVRRVSGTPGKPPAYAGTDFIVARNVRIASVYLFFDNLP
jgi:hypothetical protein